MKKKRKYWTEAREEYKSEVLKLKNDIDEFSPHGDCIGSDRFTNRTDILFTTACISLPYTDISCILLINNMITNTGTYFKELNRSLLVIDYFAVFPFILGLVYEIA